MKVQEIETKVYFIDFKEKVLIKTEIHNNMIGEVKVTFDKVVEEKEAING